MSLGYEQRLELRRAIDSHYRNRLPFFRRPRPAKPAPPAPPPPPPSPTTPPGTKACTKCGDVLELSEFNRSVDRKDGHASVCKVCARARARASWPVQSLRHGERRRAYAREQTRLHREDT